MHHYLELVSEDLCLCFLSGRLQGNELSLSGREQVLVGRTDVADLLLSDGLVSREHARFIMKDGQLAVEDLGSTNGTFVNGERVVGVRPVGHGDRVLIGTSIIKVASGSEPITEGPPTPRRPVAQRDGAPELSGDIADTSVPELLNLMVERSISGVLRLSSENTKGELRVRSGIVGAATIDTLHNASAYKAAIRLLGWVDGRYVIIEDSTPCEMTVQLPVAELLVDGLYKLDEWEVLKQRLPDAIRLARPITAPIRELSDSEIDLLQAVHNLEETARVIDSMVDADHRVAAQLLGLIDAGYLRPTGVRRD